MCIEFELRPLDEVRPWGDDETGQYLHWFALTDGRYDVAVDGHHVFQVAGESGGVAYHVGQLWDDLIDVAPFALREIPDALADRIDNPGWAEWVASAWERSDSYELAEVALGWWGRRQLHAQHLRAAPRLDLWTHRGVLHVHWFSPQRRAGDPVWASPAGKASVPAAQFRDALVAFDHALMAQTGERIEQIARGWSRTDVGVDIAMLRHEHAERMTWLDKAHAFPVDQALPPWHETLAALDQLR